MATAMTPDPLDSTQSSSSTLSPWVGQYATDMLGRSRALAQQEFTPYKGVRVADFSPLQTQAFQQYGAQKTPEQFGIATALAQQLAGQLQNPRSFTDQGIASLYMSPYQQQVIDINKREAQRQAQIANQATAAQAVGRGAFGGSRYGLVEAENQRNLQQRLADIQDKGMQDAFTAGRQQFNVEDALRMQGINAGAGIAGLLSGIGSSQGVLNLSQLRDLLAAGTTQQANEQKGLDVDYGDYVTQMQWPYKQLEFQRSMLQGLPISTSTSSTAYAPPNPFSQIVGGITTGIGAYDMFANPTPGAKK